MTSESSRKITRRRLLATTAASTALIAMPYVRGAYAAGKLSVGLWDHWVPGANDVSRKIIQEWGEKEKVDVTVDYITSQGEKLRLTMAAEAQAKSGHDLLNAELPTGGLPEGPEDPVIIAVVDRCLGRVPS